MLPLPFYQIRVLDLTTDAAGAFATRFFADLGADVIKIEDVQQPDALRANPGAFESLHRNKLGLALDTGTAGARELCHRLAAACDFVFVTADDPRSDLEALSEEENLIFVVVGGDGTASETGLAAAAGALTALFHRRLTGEGQRVDVAGPAVASSLRYLDPTAGAGAPAPEALTPAAQTGLSEPVARRNGDVVRVEGVPYRFSRTPAHIRLPAPAPGEHSEYVLEHFLGLDSAAIEAYRTAGTIGRKTPI